MTRLVLASASRSRQAMLAAAGVDFQTCPADIDETALTARLRERGADAVAIAAALAEQKALAVSRARPGRVVLGGDSVLAFGDELIAKCADLAALRHLLLRLAGKSHLLISAACLARDGVVLWHHVGQAQLTMRDFSEAFLDAYLAADGAAVLSCVGGYRYEGLGAQLFERVQGDHFTVLGLPLLPVLAALRAEGFLQT